MSIAVATKYAPYVIVIEGSGDDAEFWVTNVKGNKVNVAWATLEGATAAAELLAEGYLKE